MLIVYKVCWFLKTLRYQTIGSVLTGVFVVFSLCMSGFGLVSPTYALSNSGASSKKAMTIVESPMNKHKEFQSSITAENSDLLVWGPSPFRAYQNPVEQKPVYRAVNEGIITQVSHSKPLDALAIHDAPKVVPKEGPVLSGIWKGDSGYKAMVSQTVVENGDRVEGYSVSRVGANEVVLVGAQGEILVLSLGNK